MVSPSFHNNYEMLSSANQLFANMPDFLKKPFPSYYQTNANSWSLLNVTRSLIYNSVVWSELDKTVT